MTDATIELEITPTGKIRTVYKDSLVDVLNLIGKCSIHRASTIEWEEHPVTGERGWVVRAAHDPNLAIRKAILQYPDGQPPIYVERYGSLAYFKLREEALKEEIKHFWELLPPQENK